MLDSLNAQPIGHIELAWTSNSSASGIGGQNRSELASERLPYND